MNHLVSHYVFMKMMQNLNHWQIILKLDAYYIPVVFGEVGCGYSALQQRKLQITKAVLCCSLLPSHLSLDQ